MMMEGERRKDGKGRENEEEGDDDLQHLEKQK